MLKKIDNKNNNNSIFICDRCGKNVDWDNKYSIIVGVHRSVPAKKWDLCENCYKIIYYHVNINKIKNKKRR